MGFTTASIVAEQRGEIIQICTGSKELDLILEGAAHAHVGVRCAPLGARRTLQAGGIRNKSPALGLNASRNAASGVA